MASTLRLRYCLLVLCLAICIQARPDPYYVEKRQYDESLEAGKRQYDDSLEAGKREYDESLEAEKREIEDFEAEKRELEELEAEKRELEEFEAEKRELEEFEAEKRELDSLEAEKRELEELEAEKLELEELEAKNKRQMEKLKLEERFLFGGGSECNYYCRKGEKSVKNLNHSPSANGCGPKGATIGFRKCSYLTDCCNAHDLCYATYGASRRECDAVFKACNANSPNDLDKWSQNDCKRWGSAMDTVVRIGGCPFFLSAQRKATSCVTSEGR